jgi:hypothetical protein
MIRSLAMAFAVLALLTIGSANATLINNGNNLIYDTDLKITWYNPSTGIMNWADAVNWAAGLTAGGVTGWQLPTALNFNGTGPTYGYNVRSSELGHLYYDELGNSTDIYNTSPIITGPFSNLQSVNYWTSTIDPIWGGKPGKAFAFSFITGSQGAAFMNLDTYYSAMAIHSGNVGGANIPIPGSILLLLPGLAGIAAMKKRLEIVSLRKFKDSRKS